MNLLQHSQENVLKRGNLIDFKFGEKFIVHGVNRLQPGTVSRKPFRCDLQKMFSSVVRVTGSLQASSLFQAVRKLHHLVPVYTQSVCNRLLAQWLIVNQVKGSPLSGTEAAGGVHVSLSNFKGFIAGTAKQVRRKRTELWGNLGLDFHHSTVCQGTVRLAP